MSAEEHIQFVATKIPKCLNVIFSDLDPDMRVTLDKEMVNNMMSVFKEQLDK